MDWDTSKLTIIRIHSEETKKNMSKSGKKRHKDNPFTEETRARLSETHRGEKNYWYGKGH